MHWNLSPEIFTLGPLTIRWYGLLFALAFIFGYHILLKIFLKEKRTQKDLDGLLLYVLVGTIVGARLGHTLFYEPEYYLTHPLEIMKVWKGGLASHGAAIGVLTATYLYSRKAKMAWLWVLDRLVIVTASAGAFIRLGNLMNSEIIGKSTTVPWAFIFDRVDNLPRHPTQLYESASYWLSFFILYKIYKTKKGKVSSGKLFGLFLILIFGIRFFIEFLKENQVAFENTMTLNLGQWLSIPFVLMGVYFLIQIPKDRFHK